MKHGEFVVWNLLASLAFTISVAASAYGIGRLFSGDHSAQDIATLVVGLLVGAGIMMLYVRHRRRVRVRADGSVPPA
jgi:membrane protein DedA with SNARE-associated domain